MNPVATQNLWTRRSNVLRCFEASFVVANKPGNSHNELFLQYPGRSLRYPRPVLGQQKFFYIIIISLELERIVQILNGAIQEIISHDTELCEMR